MFQMFVAGMSQISIVVLMAWTGLLAIYASFHYGLELIRACKHPILCTLSFGFFASIGLADIVVNVAIWRGISIGFLALASMGLEVYLEK